jgi:hypothetical protein
MEICVERIFQITNTSTWMKKDFPIPLCCLFSVLTNMSVLAQDCDCIPYDSSQKQLYLNGNNFTLIDNALRYFKLTSVAELQDSLVRIWLLEDDLPHDGSLTDETIGNYTMSVKMLEFGKRGTVPHATLHVLQWRFEKKDSSRRVKCIKQIKLIPNEGWQRFEKHVRSLHLLKLYQNQFINKGEIMVEGGMLIFQFLFGLNTYTVDFIGFGEELIGNENTLLADHAKRIKYLFTFIEQDFSIKLAVDSLGRELF